MMGEVFYKQNYKLYRNLQVFINIPFSACHKVSAGIMGPVSVM